MVHGGWGRKSVTVNVTAAWHELNLLPIVFLLFSWGGAGRSSGFVAQFVYVEGLAIFWGQGAGSSNWSYFEGPKQPKYGVFSILWQQFSWIFLFLYFCNVFFFCAFGCWPVFIWQLGNNETNDWPGARRTGAALRGRPKSAGVCSFNWKQGVALLAVALKAKLRTDGMANEKLTIIAHNSLKLNEATQMDCSPLLLSRIFG